jgi:hypothetical protein
MTSFELAALYIVINWATDKNNYIAASMMAMMATMVICAAIKVAATKMAK